MGLPGWYGFNFSMPSWAGTNVILHFRYFQIINALNFNLKLSATTIYNTAIGYEPNTRISFTKGRISSMAAFTLSCST